MKELMNITKAMADANRVRILMFLGRKELCVCQIIEMLHLAPSTVSKHLDILHQSGLIASRKDGRWVYYRLSKIHCTRIKGAIGWLHASLSDDPLVVQDARRLRSVLMTDKDRLCCRYKARPRKAKWLRS